MHHTLNFFWLKKTSLTISLSIFFLCLTKLCAAQETKKANDPLLNIDTQDSIIYLAVAANFKSTLQLLVNSFLLQHPEINKKQLSIISGATGTLYAQITQGAPFDIFFAADSLRPTQLIEKNYASNETLHSYAYGKLALAFKAVHEQTLCNKSIKSSLAFKDLLKQLQPSSNPVLAIANPATAPYGESAQSLINDLSEPFAQYKIVRGKNILHTQQLLLNSNVDLAILAAAQAKHPTMANYQFCIINQSLYTPIEQAMVIIKQAERTAKGEYLTLEFFDFIKTDSAKIIISANGYATND